MLSSPQKEAPGPEPSVAISPSPVPDTHEPTSGLRGCAWTFHMAGVTRRGASVQRLLERQVFGAHPRRSERQRLPAV